MKCNAALIYTTRGKHPLVFGASASEETIEKYCKKYEVTSREICGGKIIAKVEAIDEPTWGESYAKLEVSYKCKKCGWEHFEGLPSEYDLSEWITKRIEEYNG